MSELDATDAPTAHPSTRRLRLVTDDATDREPPAMPLLERIGAAIRARMGWDIGGYRASTLLRRLGRRMQLLDIADEDAYLELLRQRPEEVRALAEDLLVPVTSFFRDPPVFEQLEAVVIPRLFDRLAPGEPVRAWSVGCATGQEAYSLAILLHEEAMRRDLRTPIRVFATDLHERSLAVGRGGLYSAEIEAQVSPERLARFFRPCASGYHVDPQIRDSIVFTTHDLLADPPFSRVDLVACRNVLIYLREPMRRRALEIFHYALVPGGDLMLGTSDPIDEDLFAPQLPRRGVVRRRDVRVRPPWLDDEFPSRVRAPEKAGDAATEPETLPHGVLHERMILASAPASVLVTPDDKIAHISTEASRYLAHPVGRPTTRVHALVRGELLAELRVLLVAARGGHGTVRSQVVTVRSGTERFGVVMHASAAEDATAQGYVLLSFQEHPCVGPWTGARAEVPDDFDRARTLELEVDRAKSTIRALAERYQATQEDLKASNWELQAANEELRSTLEELEARKEELELTHERLQEADGDNRRRVTELGGLTRQLEQCLEATEIPLVALDRDLRIVRSSAAIAAIFNVRPTDLGRPLLDFTCSLHYPELGRDLAAVLERPTRIEREVFDGRNRWYLARMVCSCSAADTIDGVILTFVDITDLERADDCGA